MVCEGFARYCMGQKIQNACQLQFSKWSQSVPRVTKGDKDMMSLGQWVAQQRKYHEENKLLQNRALKLDSIGFRWSIKSAT